MITCIIDFIGRVKVYVQNIKENKQHTKNIKYYAIKSLEGKEIYTISLILVTEKS